MATQKLRLWRTDCGDGFDVAVMPCDMPYCEAYKRDKRTGGCAHCRELPVTGLWQAIDQDGKPRSRCLGDRTDAVRAVLSIMGHDWPHWYRRGWRIVRVWQVREV